MSGLKRAFLGLRAEIGNFGGFWRLLPWPPATTDTRVLRLGSKPNRRLGRLWAESGRPPNAFRTAGPSRGADLCRTHPALRCARAPFLPLPQNSPEPAKDAL